MMLLWAVTLCLLALTVNGKDSSEKKFDCHKFGNEFCLPKSVNSLKIDSCTSHYSGIDEIKENIHQFTANHIDQNWHYLLMSANFGNFKANREGFSKLFRKLADDTWEDTMDLIKYMSKRGFNMNYTTPSTKEVTIKSHVMNELESLSTALDMQKSLAEETHNIHKLVSEHNKAHHDAEVVNFIEKKFVGKHSETIRNLAGHVNDLHSLIVGKLGRNSLDFESTKHDPSLAIYMFDEYLKKIIS